MKPSRGAPAGEEMRAEDLVDAALLGFERGESVTLPSLHDVALWDTSRNGPVSFSKD